MVTRRVPGIICEPEVCTASYGTARVPGLLWTLRRVQGLRFTLERD